MNNEWQHFLTSNGAVEDASGSISFDGDKPLASDNQLSVLSAEVVLRVTGADAETFLQGQFSNDVAALATPGSQLTTWSTPKGRVLALFRLIRDDEGYLIQIPAGLAETFIKRLRMYVLMAKVQIEPQPEHICVGLSGPASEELIKQLVTGCPAGIDDCVINNNVVVTRVRGEQPRYELILPVEQAKQYWPQWTVALQTCGQSAWQLQNIDNGVPSINANTSEAFVLQMLNLQHINGVSFKKGCFPGQEVVARMQYLGKLKRRMYRASGLLDGVDMPQAGDELYNDCKTSAVGKVVDAQQADDKSYRLLAVCAIDATENPLYLEPEAQNKIELIDLPYSVDAS